MTDIYLGIAFMLTLAALAGLVAYRAARAGGAWVGVPIAALAVVALALNVAYFRHSVWPAKFLPFPNLMVLAEPSPILAAILVGAGAVILPGGAARRALWLVPLMAVCLFASYGYLVGTPPHLRTLWRAGVCRQTSPASCGPAAAATLLATCGIPATEAEMAQLCLTTGDGTSSRAIYRGLLLKTAGTDRKVEVFRGDLDALRKLDGPILLNVRLDPTAKTDPKYEQKYGWRPGVAHSVVCFRTGAADQLIRNPRRRPPGNPTMFEIGDPSVGREIWDQKAIETLWHGEGFRLVPR